MCDSPEQLGGWLRERNYEVEYYLTEIKRSEQSSWGGWRWHKWGDYIGRYDIAELEYLVEADGEGGRPLIDSQWCFGQDHGTHCFRFTATAMASP